MVKSGDHPDKLTDRIELVTMKQNDLSLYAMRVMHRIENNKEEKRKGVLQVSILFMLIACLNCNRYY